MLGPWPIIVHRWVSKRRRRERMREEGGKQTDTHNSHTHTHTRTRTYTHTHTHMHAYMLIHAYISSRSFPSFPLPPHTSEETTQRKRHLDEQFEISRRQDPTGIQLDYYQIPTGFPPGIPLDSDLDFSQTLRSPALADFPDRMRGLNLTHS